MALKATPFKPFPDFQTKAVRAFARHTRSALVGALAGVNGPLPDDVTEAFRQAASSLTTLLKALDRLDSGPVVAAAAPAYAPQANGGQLNSREKDVLRLMCAGYNNAQIAKKLSYGLGTIKADVRAILVKLSATDRTEAAVVAVRRGLI